jgi:hypothetical protein
MKKGKCTINGKRKCVNHNNTMTDEEKTLKGKDEESASEDSSEDQEEPKKKGKKGLPPWLKKKE